MCTSVLFLDTDCVFDNNKRRWRVNNACTYRIGGEMEWEGIMPGGYVDVISAGAGFLQDVLHFISIHLANNLM